MDEPRFYTVTVEPALGVAQSDDWPRCSYRLLLSESEVAEIVSAANRLAANSQRRQAA